MQPLWCGAHLIVTMSAARASETDLAATESPPSASSDTSSSAACSLAAAASRRCVRSVRMAVRAAASSIERYWATESSRRASSRLVGRASAHPTSMMAMTWPPNQTGTHTRLAKGGAWRAGMRRVTPVSSSMSSRYESEPERRLRSLGGTRRRRSALPARVAMVSSPSP